MDRVTNAAAGNLPQSNESDQGPLATSFKAAAGMPREDMVVPPPPPPPPQAPPPAAGSPLSEAESLSANWGNWGMHDGVDFHNPPSRVSSDEKSTLAYFANNSVLYQAMIKDNGGTGNTLTKADVDQFITDAKGDAQAAADARQPDGTSSNGTLHDLGDIVTNWHAWGLHSGDTPFSNPPPSDLPPDAKAALGTITSNPYLLSQIGNHTGSGAITRDDVANFLSLASKNPVVLGVAPEQDTHVQGWLASLGDAVSSQDKTALAQTANDAQTVLDFFDAYPRNAPELNSEVPSDVAAAEHRLLGVDAIKKQITTSDGTVTRDTLGAFLDNLDTTADSAKSSWKSFQQSEPNADPAVTHLAADASILQADSPILDEAGAGSKLDGEINATDLEAVGAAFTPALLGAAGAGLTPVSLGSGNSGSGSSGGNFGDASLPSALRSAAALFGSPGMLATLDTAGDDPATTAPDGLVDANDLGSFISDTVAKMTPTKMLDMIAGAADRNLTASVDVSHLGSDVFAHPQKYSGAQKTAVLLQLEDLQVKVNVGLKEGIWQTEPYNSPGNDGVRTSTIRPDPAAVQASLKSKINQLSRDHSVQQFIATNSPKSIQAIVDADPGLKAAVQSDFDNLQSGTALKATLNAKGVSTIEQGLTNYMNQLGPYAQALGSGGESAPLNLRKAAENSGEEGTLKEAYKRDILGGAELDKMIAGGTTIDQAVKTFMSDAANFSAVLPSSFIKQNTSILQNNFSNTLSDALLGSTTQGALNAAFADKNGNLDTAKLAAILQQIEKENPDAFNDAAGQSISPDKIISAFKYVWDEFRQIGGKLPDALAKGQAAQWKAGGEQGPKPPKPTGALAEAYSSGVMHIVSALFATGALVAKGVEGGSTVAASSVAGAFQVTGGLMEGGSKYAKTLSTSDKPPKWIPSENTLKTIETAGKTLGGTGGVIAGAVSIFGGVQALDSGDKLGAGLDLGSGIIQTLSGAASATEGIAGFAGVGDAAAAALGETSAILGGAAAGVGLIAFLGLSFYDLIAQINAPGVVEESQTLDQLQQWGVIGPNGPFL